MSLSTPSAPAARTAERSVRPVPPPFREVYEQHFDFVWRCAAHRGVPAAALDDVVQEVFIIVHRKLAEFEGRASLRTWIGAIVPRLVADFVKKRGNRPAGDEALEREPPASAGVDPVEQHAAVALLDELLASMPEEQREVFVLRELEDLTGAEIAALTGVNENTVWTRLRAARRTFQQGVTRARARHTREQEP